MDNNINKDNIGNSEENNTTNDKKLRCINIDCVFNSTNNTENVRNTCNHPKLAVDSKYADITIAICSEFRSKKDYRFEAPNKLFELRTNTEIEITGIPDPSSKQVEKVTTEELEKGYLSEHPDTQATIIEEKTLHPTEVEYVSPVIIGEDEILKQTFVAHLTTDKPTTDLQLIKRLYQPHMKRGIVVSVLIHLFVIWILFIFATEKAGDKNKLDQPQQRIVVVEDLLEEKPKFEPPDIDRPKEVKTNITDNGTVLPQIKPKTVIPKIHRPKTLTQDTAEITKRNQQDSIKARLDSLLSSSKSDTSRLIVPDSLKNIIADNAVGISLSRLKGWGIIKNTDLGLPIEQFKGLILGLDSTTEDYRKVQIIINVDDPKHSVFNKSAYKNTFDMNDTTNTIFAYSTDPQVGGKGKITYKFFINSDPTGNSNLFINADIENKAIFDKYKKEIEYMVRSIRTVPKPPSGEIKK